MSVNVRSKQYYEMNYDWTQKGMDVSAMSFHKTIKAAWDLDAMNEWGSIVVLSLHCSFKEFSHI